MAVGVPAATTLPPAFPPPGTQVDDPVGAFDDIEIVLNHNERVFLVTKAVEYLKKRFDIRKVKTCCRFVEQINRLAGRGFPEFAGQFDRAKGSDLPSSIFVTKKSGAPSGFIEKLLTSFQQLVKALAAHALSYSLLELEFIQRSH